MRHVILSVILVMSLSYALSAQTIITGIVTDSLKNPIAGASVYLSKTTFGTITDSGGAYSLTINQTGVYELTSSCIGYKSFSQFISAENIKQKIDIKLSLNLVQLSEVSVTAREKNHLANYTQFVKLFLGETENSEYCKITNPDDLHLFVDDKEKSLNGFTVKPLHIENRALGYSVIYDLSDFKYQKETGLLRFRGDYYFQTLTGSHKDSIRWIRNRLSAYYGSRMDLFRAIFSDSVTHENFKIFECTIDSVTGEFTIIKPLLVSDLSLSKNKNYLTLFHKNPVLISYTDNHPELATGLTGFTPRKVISTIGFFDFINIYPNGYFDNPYSITWGGEMINERVADMLPYDFQPKIHEKQAPGTGPSLSPIEKYLFSEQKNKSSDQVFVHTDRNLYAPGDTIFFQAYIRDRFSSLFESKSSSMYALLFDDSRNVIDSARFKVDKSTSSGWMTIPEKAKTGQYHFVAFTGMMQNSDPMDAFQTDLKIREKVYSHYSVKVVYNKNSYNAGDSIIADIKMNDTDSGPIGQRKFQCSLLTGNNYIKTIESKTNRNGESHLVFILPDTVSNQPRLEVVTLKTENKPSIGKDFTVPFEDQNFEFRFLPEGGTLVAGLEQRVGFNYTDFQGEPVNITGLLKNSSGKVIDTIRSGPFGPGYFVCTPEPGMYVELSDIVGKERKWPLPDPIKKGFCLSVKPLNERSFAIEIQSSDYNGETVNINGVMNSALILSRSLQMNKRQRIVVETDQLVSGVAVITLFNSKMNPLAERLIYVNSDKHLIFKIIPDNTEYQLGSDTELSVSVTDSKSNPVEGIFSISVADSVSGHSSDIFTPGIEYSYNYSQYIPGGLPATVLLKGLENLSDNDRDLLFLVYGWSKYNWDFNLKSVASDKPVDYELLKMKILYTLKINRSDRRLDLISLEGPSVKHLLTNSTGRSPLPLDSLPEITRSITIMPDPAHKKRVMGAMLSIPFNEKYFKSNKLYMSAPYVPEIPAVAQSRLSGGKITSLGDDVIEIPAVDIIGKPRPEKIYHDEFEKTYQSTNIKSLDYKLLWSSFSVTDAIYRLISPYAMTEKYIFLRPPRSMMAAPIPALIVRDGIPLFLSEGWETVKYMATSELTSLTVLMGPDGYARYGASAQGGVIFVNTHNDDPAFLKIRTNWLAQNSKNDMLLPIQIYRAQKEFYVPSKSDIDNDPTYLSRSTILWKSEVYFNGKEPVKIKYHNLRHHGPVIITINGASYNNLVGTGRAGYIVE